MKKYMSIILLLSLSTVNAYSQTEQEKLIKNIEKEIKRLSELKECVKNNSNLKDLRECQQKTIIHS